MDQNRGPKEAKSPRTDLGLGLALIGVAGCVDAIGFLRLGGLFVSFMSGNSTKMAVAFAHGRHAKGLEIVAIIASFVAGSTFGRLVARRAGERARSAVIGVVAVLLGISAALPGTRLIVLLPMALAMGAQNAALQRMGPVRASLTYVTGTLAHLGERIADAIDGEKWTWVPYALMWLAMIVGAFAGALLYDSLGSRALFVPCAFVIALSAITLFLPREEEVRG